MASVPRVLVTGASGFIGAHITNHLLEAGWNVRGTVRDPSNAAKTEYLKSLPGASERLELVRGDLAMTPEEWAPVVSGCDFVLHVASPFHMSSGSRSDEEVFIKPAVSGVEGVVKACIADKGVKRVVVTSSCASVAYGHKEGMGAREWNEKDWSVVGGPRMGGYSTSKTLAERKAWELAEKQPEGRGLEMVTINPSFVLGPMISPRGCTSQEILTTFLSGGLPAIPDLYMATVDVRSVAWAHVRALVVPEAAGERFIVSDRELSFRDIADTLRDPLGDSYKSIPTWGMPNWLVHFMACFSSQAAEMAAGLSQHFRVSNTKAREVLGVDFLDSRSAIVTMAEDSIRLGHTKDLTADKVYSEGGAKAAQPESGRRVRVEGIRPSDLAAAGSRAGAAASASSSSGRA